ncbi:FMN-dependent NADH-azoreductase [Cupriavidus pampae]|uniref:FMN dependent NADH:quinone oxidoreductase n=1 Tax=Cupriavidus pampae TaxID=659251 RepID=A0ABM8X0C9_9BURK|nr:NAD(P)H-dependent oxidoreductase [Cupriavidus pampae]CAG9173307.1 FMN-dependent NADH-azoreductase [Cupriavidus pampae]
MKPLELLLLDCSPRRDNSTSRHLTNQLLPALTHRFGRPVHVTQRHLGVKPVPAITAEYADSLVLPAEEARARFGNQLAVSDELIRELDAAEVVWISTPVHNFTVPAVLKNWIDHVVRRDVTFVTKDNRKVGLLRDRPVYVAVTAGGAMFREPAIQPDFFRPYLTAVLGVIGLKDITYLPSTSLAGVDAPLELVQTHASRHLAAAALQI